MSDTKKEYIIKCSSDDYPSLETFLKEHDIAKGRMTVRTYLAGTYAPGATSSDIIQDIFATEEELLLLKVSFSIMILE